MTSGITSGRPGQKFGEMTKQQPKSGRWKVSKRWSREALSSFLPYTYDPLPSIMLSMKTKNYTFPQLPTIVV
jgi:hypothetical protein